MEVREEVRRSESFKIPSPAHKRFNSSSPLITLSVTLQKLWKCLHVCLCVGVCVQHGEQMRETEAVSRSVVTIEYFNNRPMEFLFHE